MNVNSMLSIALLCEDLLAEKPYVRDFDDNDCQTSASLDTFVERIKHHFLDGDNQLYSEHPRRGEDLSFWRDS